MCALVGGSEKVDVHYNGWIGDIILDLNCNCGTCVAIWQCSFLFSNELFLISLQLANV